MGVVMRAWLAVCLAMLLPIAAAAQSPSERLLRIGLREDPDLLDPTLGSSYVGRVVFAGMCDRLFDINSRLEIVPQLATGYEFKDPTHLTIHLRPGVTFQDGEKLDAEAVKFKLLRDLTAKGSLRKGDVSSIESIDVVDALTVSLNLKVPDATLLAQLTDRAGIVLSPKAVREAGDAFGLHPVCAGAFAFVERVPQDRMVLRRFDGYWNAGAIHLDRVIYQPIPNSAVRLANLQAGSLDMVEYVVPTDAPAIQKDPRLKLVVGDSLAYMGITINLAHGPAARTPLGQHAEVRQALDMAIDRKALVDVVYNGLYTPTAQANPPGSPFYVPQFQPPAMDVAKARALLLHTGVKLPVPVVLTIPNNPDLLQVGEVIQAMTRDAGFDVHIKVMEFASALQAARSGEFESFLIYFSGRADADGNMWPFLHSANTSNYQFYNNPLVDQLLDEARGINDVGRRRDIYAKVWQEERKDLPIVYLWTYKNTVGINRRVIGFEPVPDGLIRLTGVSLAN
jgi:peptide/nickel transport system substrate-binding protein